MPPQSPSGFGENLGSRFYRKEGGKSRERMAREREQRQRIADILTSGKPKIDDAWKKARGDRANVFGLTTEDLTAGGLLDRQEVATAIRRWIFEHYRGELGLYLYSDRPDGPHEIHFAVTNKE